MKRLFVVAPMKYGMNNEQVNAYRVRLERMAYEQSKKLAITVKSKTAYSGCLTTLIHTTATQKT